MQHFSERLLKKRLVIVFFLFLLLLFVVVIRLFYVQVIAHEQLYEKAIESWTRELPLEPKRGTIYDRNGKPIVSNESAPSLFIIPKQIEDRDHTATQLSDILKVPEEKAKEFVSRKGSIEKLHPEGRKLNFEQVRALEEAALPGVYIADDYKRSYPQGRMLSHVLGFIGVDNRGLSGLELLYDEQLYGVKGAEGLFTDAKGKEMDQGSYHKEPTHGMDLHLTIDLDVQNVLERELTNAQETYDADQILAIAMSPKTGEILGMASRPDFDPSHYQKFSPDIYNRVLPIWRTYEPGSTFKIITLAAALEEGLVDLEKESFYDSGHVEVGGVHLHCWQREGHGSQTFLEVVQNSCNPGFIELGNRLGKDRLLSYIHDFGFGQKTGIDLTGEASGILFKPENMGPVEQATTAFGQGVSVTPIQQAAAVSAVINGGTLPTPVITKKWTDPISGETLHETPVKMKKKVISEDVSAEMREALESVVAQGTGRGAFVEGYRVGGKTGTAQKVENGQYMKDSYIVSFIGFAPSDDPEILVYLAVDHPKNTIQFGGVVAAPIVGNIIEESLNVLGVEKRKDQIEKEVRWTDPPEIKVPDLIGKTKSELLDLHLNVNLEIKGEGKKVIRQSPEAGTVIPEGETLRIFIGQ